MKTDIENELVTILERNTLVETAEVSVINLEENDFNRQKRTIQTPQVRTRTIIIHFESACYVHLAKIVDINAIKISLMESIENSETFLPSNSSLNVVQPKVIDVAPIDEGKSSLIFLLESTLNFFIF